MREVRRMRLNAAIYLRRTENSMEGQFLKIISKTVVQKCTWDMSHDKPCRMHVLRKRFVWSGGTICQGMTTRCCSEEEGLKSDALKHGKKAID